jgi:hypothetical protein
MSKMNVVGFKKIQTGISFGCIMLALALRVQSAPLTAGEPILLPGMQDAAGKLTALGDVPDETGTGDIVVDPKTHTVWIAYAKGSQCFVQPFTVTK